MKEAIIDKVSTFCSQIFGDKKDYELSEEYHLTFAFMCH